MKSGKRLGVGGGSKMFDFVLKNSNTSQLEKDIGPEVFPANEHYFGLVNVRDGYTGRSIKNPL